MRKTKYKVGDKVRVRTDLVLGETYYNDDKKLHDSFVGEMQAFAGKVVTITSAHGKYWIEDGGSWNWVDEMFEPVHKFKAGDKVQIRTDLVTGRDYDGITIHREMNDNAGKIGTIDRVTQNGNYYIFGWYYPEIALEPVCEPAKPVRKKKAKCNKKVKIETDGETTTATLYEGRKVIRTATAKCAPEDEFDFELGMNLALDRLFDPEQK